jgi:hypothetical protein
MPVDTPASATAGAVNEEPPSRRLDSLNSSGSTSSSTPSPSPRPARKLAARPGLVSIL